MLWTILGVLILIVIPLIFIRVTNHLKRKKFEPKLTKEELAETLERQQQLKEQREFQRNIASESTVRPGTTSTSRPSTTTTSNSAFIYSSGGGSSDNGGSSDASCGGGGGCD